MIGKLSMVKIGVTGVILAGGQARRMNGCDKGQIQIVGKPLYQYAISKLLPQVDYLLINANRNITEYQQAGYPVIVDTIVDFAGPLAGMLASLYAAQTSWVVFVPCDVPNFPDNLVMKLWQGRKENVGSYVTSAGSNHPTFALLHRSVIPALEENLIKHQHKVMFFMKKICASAVNFVQDGKNFVNLNTLAECYQWEQQQTNDK